MQQCTVLTAVTWQRICSAQEVFSLQSWLGKKEGTTVTAAELGYPVLVILSCPLTQQHTQNAG